MAYNFVRGDRDQPFLLPPDLRDWLPEGHLAWFVLDVVDQLDLEPFLRVYRADGKRGYKLVKTLAPKRKSFTDTKVKPGHTYKYKTVGVNAKGQQGKASKAATAKVKKQP